MHSTEIGSRAAHRPNTQNSMVAPSDQKRLETKKLKAIHCLVVLKTTAIALFLFLTGSSLFGQTSAGTINMGNTTTSV
ncbi:MAG TPA: hypothetical protein PK758_07065, partial [Tenuifilaceae bacterium]|nr:hypothetical protein [Tenuifilaceae bacterium]